MSSSSLKVPKKYLAGIYINGMHGRMMRLPSKVGKKREILIIYGQQTNLERLYPFAKGLNRYGGVTIPDMPGFGGMQSFYKIGEKATIDNLADYLASFIKLRYPRRKFNIFGLSFGFAITVRMLQKYPDLAKRVDLLVGIKGFVHHEDIATKRRDSLAIRYGSIVLSGRLTAWAARQFLLRPLFINDNSTNSWHVASTDSKAKRGSLVDLWRQNDLRTHMNTSAEILKLDLCEYRINLPIYHINATQYSYLNVKLLEQHLKIIFDKVYMLDSKMPVRIKQESYYNYTVLPLLPPKIKRLLSK